MKKAFRVILSLGKNKLYMHSGNVTRRFFNETFWYDASCKKADQFLKGTFSPFFLLSFPLWSLIRFPVKQWLFSRACLECPQGTGRDCGADLPVAADTAFMVRWKEIFGRKRKLVHVWNIYSFDSRCLCRVVGGIAGAICDCIGTGVYFNSKIQEMMYLM